MRVAKFPDTPEQMHESWDAEWTLYLYFTQPSDALESRRTKYVSKFCFIYRRRHCAVTGTAISVNTSSHACLSRPFLLLPRIMWIMGTAWCNWFWDDYIRKITAIYWQLWSLVRNNSKIQALNGSWNTTAACTYCNLVHYHSIFGTTFYV